MKGTSRKSLLIIVTIFLCCVSLVSCAPGDTLGGGSSPNTPSEGSKPSSSSSSSIDLNAIAASPNVELKYVPVSGDVAEVTDNGVIDYSMASSGYFMAKYTGEVTGNEQDIVLFVMTPNPEFPKYQYYLSQNGDFFAFPFSEGNGAYTISLLKRVQGQEYAQLMAVQCNVTLSDELLPFLITNHKVRYAGDSLSVKLASELIKENTDFFDQIGSVYDYVISNVIYDTDKAAAAANGELVTYVPDNDQTLRTNKGICFDYATLTTAMLRSIDIQTKVVFGFASTGEGTDPVYHAWISVYSKSSGWVDNIIEFAANGWTRMDPTFSAGSRSKDMANFIGDGSNYADDLHF